MSNSVKPIPEGHGTVTPHLVIKDAAKAIDFYVKAFGAEELCRMSCPMTGKLMHGEILIGDSRVYLADECPEYGSFGPGESSPVTIHLYVPDADVTFNQAVEAGATATMPPADMFWGDRFGKLVDPFGHHWSVATHIEDLTPEQMAEKMKIAMAEWAPAEAGASA